MKKREFEYSYTYSYNVTLRVKNTILNQMSEQWGDEYKSQELHQQFVTHMKDLLFLWGIAVLLLTSNCYYYLMFLLEMPYDEEIKKEKKALPKAPGSTSERKLSTTFDYFTTS